MLLPADWAQIKDRVASLTGTEERPVLDLKPGSVEHVPTSRTRSRIGGLTPVFVALALGGFFPFQQLAAQTVIYYSVGTNATDLKTGSPTVTIAAGTATLTVPQPDHIGVGDEITYNGGTRAFISGRTSSTVYSITDRLGAVPPNIGPGIVVDSIMRAFNTLKDAALNSDTAGYLGTADLVAGGFQLNWPCYADGPDPSDYVRIEEP